MAIKSKKLNFDNLNCDNLKIFNNAADLNVLSIGNLATLIIMN